MFTKNPILSPPKFTCDICDVITNNKKDYNKHLLTRKHQNVYNCLQNGDKNPLTKYVCECGKKYNYRQSLYVHKKKCTNPITEAGAAEAEAAAGAAEAEAPIKVVDVLINENKDFKNLILELMKNNTDLQKQMLEVCKNSSTNINNSHNNSHNKTFNMQFFLNEQCKDAMNIMDFANSFQLQMSDLERVGELGYVDGISDIIIKKLNEMDIYKRPIHCSDTKRDIMYVRAENVWEKETNGHDRLRLFIKQITHKNIKLIPLWAETHPQAKDHQHPLNDNYLSMVSQAMGGRGNLEESENKIIKRIAKTVYIDKYQV